MITLLAFLGLYAAGVVFAIAKRPVYGLYIYLLAFYFNPVNTWWGKDLPDLRWSLLAAAVTLGAIILHSQKSGDRKPTAPGFNIALTLFTIWIALQSFWALHSGLHAQYRSIAINFVILYWLIQKTCTEKNDITWFIICNGIGCAYLGWYAGALGRSGRLEGIGPPALHDANFLALHIAGVLIMLGFVLMGLKDKKKYFLIPLILLMLNGIVLTQSRGAMVGIVMGAAFTLLYLPKEFKLQVAFYGLLGVTAIIAVIDDRYAERLLSTVSAQNDDELDRSAYSRIVIIQAQLEMFTENPIKGTGHRGTMILSPKYIDQMYMTESGGQSVRASHNTYMSVLVEQGLVGFVLYIWLLLGAFSKAQKVLRKNSGITDLYIKAMMLGVTASFFGTLAAVFFVDALRLEIIVWQIALIYLLHHMAMRSKQEQQIDQTDKQKS